MQKALCLVGEGGNGKGVFLQLATSFVGPENVSNLTLQRLEVDRFAVARLQGKLANICADLPATRLVDCAVFKAITGGDRLTGELKYQNSFEFTPFVRLLFSANQFPASRDFSGAFLDRWLIVPFERRFRESAEEIPRRVLDARLSHPQQLSGALNCALSALGTLRQRSRFSENRTTRSEIEAFRLSANPLAYWFGREIVSGASEMIPQSELYTAYLEACSAAERPVLTRQMFGRYLKQLRPDLEEAQRVVQGQRCWVYLGINLRNGGKSLAARDPQPLMRPQPEER
jgi:putative DNA primase/helicase